MCGNKVAASVRRQGRDNCDMLCFASVVAFLFLFFLNDNRFKGRFWNSRPQVGGAELAERRFENL